MRNVADNAPILEARVFASLSANVCAYNGANDASAHDRIGAVILLRLRAELQTTDASPYVPLRHDEWGEGSLATERRRGVGYRAVSRMWQPVRRSAACDAATHASLES